MATFQDDLIAFIKDTATGDLLITKTMQDGWLADAARDVISYTPVQKLWASSAQTSLTNATGASISTRKILGVTRNDGNFDNPARRVPPSHVGRVFNKEDTQFAIKEDPVYFLKNQVLRVAPTPTAGQPAQIDSVSYPTPSATASTISGFEDDAELLVRQYMKIQAKYREMGIGRRNSQDEIEAGIVALSSASSQIGTAVTAMAKVAQLVNSATAFSASAIAELGSLFGQTTGGSFSRFATAITDVQGNADSAISILSSASTDKNSVRALLIGSATGSTSSTPSGIEAVTLLNADDLEKAGTMIQIARGRVEESSGALGVAGAKISEAQAELANIQGHVAPINAYYAGSAARLKEASGYIAEAGGYLQVAQSGFAQTGGRIQASEGYLKHSAQAKAEADTLQEKYEKDRTAYANG